MKQFALFSLLLILTLGACKKYPDSPMISFITRAERIEGKWKADQVLYNDVDSTSSFKLHIWEFTRNQSVIRQVLDTKELGFWTTGNRDSDFIVEMDNGERTTYEIRRLKRKEFWIKNRKTQLEFRLVNIK